MSKNMQNNVKETQTITETLKIAKRHKTTTKRPKIITAKMQNEGT